MSPWEVNANRSINDAMEAASRRQLKKLDFNRVVSEG